MIKLTRNCVEHKVSRTIFVQVLQQIKVLRQCVINGTGLVLGRLPEALTNVVDANPDGNEQVLSRPWSLCWGGNQIVLELANLCNQVCGDTSVDDGVGNISPVVRKVVGKYQRAVELLGDHADPVETASGS